MLKLNINMFYSNVGRLIFTYENMKKKRISVLEWESMVNTLAITSQENKYMDVLNHDSLQSMKETEREINEVAAIKQKYDRAYYVRSNKR